MTEQQPPEPATTEAFNPRLVEILDQYMIARRAGSPPDHQELFAKHPELADELKSCLEGIDLLSPSTNVATRGQIGDFLLDKEIGRGGMGVVYQAHQASLNRPVAVKILNLPLHDPKVMERFQREAATAAGLHHTNIVPIYEVGSENGTHYYAMQLIEGSSLAEVLRDTEEPLDLDTLATWGLQAAEALAHAHQHGVIHRDIKPSNLILDEEQRIWLTDFGLARRMDDVRLSATGAVLGTPRYMSPEQASAISHPVDARTDIYSLGATLYELACGHPAVQGDTPVAVISSLMNDQRCSPREYRAAISRDFETILLRCLEKQPQDRYANAHDLASDLRALAEHRPISSRPVSLYEKTRRWFAHHQGSVRWAVTGGVAAITLLCLAIWFALVYPTVDDASVSLNTTAPGLIADFEPLDTDSDSFSVSVPTTGSFLLDAGQYRLRLSQLGRFSQDARHWFRPGDDCSVLLPPPPEPIWSVDGVVNSLQAEFDTGVDVIIVTDQVIQRRDARTGEVVWSRDKVDLDLTNDNQIRTYPSAWGMAPEAPPAIFQPAPICSVGGVGSETTDLNQDEHADLLFASHSKPAILALSGADGSTLWKRQYATDFGLSMDANGTRCCWLDPGHPAVGSQSSVDNVSAQPRAIFTSNRGAPSQAWVIQIDGHDGSLMWKSSQTFASMGSREAGSRFKVLSESANAQSRRSQFVHPGYTYIDRVLDSSSWLHQVENAMLLTQIGNQSLLSLLDDRVASINTNTGEATDIVMLPEAPVGDLKVMRYSDSTGQRQRGYLIASQTKRLNSLPDTEQQVIALYNNDFTSTLWQRTVRADPESSLWRWTGQPQLPLVTDLNHDGLDEVVIQVDRTDLPSSHFYRGTAWADLQIVDSSGKNILSESARVPTADVQLLHVQTVGDQDADGWDDLAIAARYKSRRDDRGAVHIDLISSRTGSRLWYRKLHLRSLSQDETPPEIFRIQSDRWNDREYLIIETARDSGFKDVMQFDTTILNPQNGSIISVGNQLSIELIIKQNDQAKTLWCRDRSPLPVETSDTTGQTFKMFRTNEQTVQASQHAQFAADFDGDGFREMRVNRISGGIGSGAEEFVSTRTGDLVSVPLTADGTSIHSLLVDSDLTGNGHRDYLAWHHQETFQLFEGKTRKQAWSLSESVLTDANSVAAVIPASLTRSGEKDLILVTFAEHTAEPSFGSGELPLLIMGVRGSDGKVIWMRDFGTREQGYDKQLHHDVGDINGDGRTDLLFGYYHPLKSPTLFALDGSSGETIWEFDEYCYSQWLRYFPQPILFAGTSRQHVAWLDAIDSNSGYELTVIDATEARAPQVTSFPAKFANVTRYGKEDRWGRHQLLPLGSADPQSQRIAFWIMNDDQQIEIHFGAIDSGNFQAVGEPITFDDDVNLMDDWKRWFTLLAADTEQDGNDEIILSRRDAIEAYAFDGALIWRQPFDGDVAVLESIRQTDALSECVATINTADNSAAVIGVNLQDGSLRWKSQGLPGHQIVPNNRDPIRGLADDRSPLPTVVFADRRHQSWTAVKARADGGAEIHDSLSELAPAARQRTAIDYRTLGAGPYPGALDIYGGRRYRFPGRFLWSIVWSLFAVMVPAWLLYQMIRKRRFSLSMMLAMTAALAACFAVLTIPVGSRVVTISARLEMGFWITPFFLWIGLTVAFYVRSQKWAMFALLVSPFILLFIYEIYKIATFNPERIAIAADLPRVWRGLLYTIPIVIVICGPIWAPVWFSRGIERKPRQSLRRSS